MKHLFKYLLFVVCFSFIACKSNKREIKSSDFIAINIENPINITVEELIEDYDTIRLEILDESILDNISQLQIMDNNLYILNGNYTAIFIFSNDGKFIGKIHDVGQGPKEYTKISTFSIDYINKQVIVLDGFSKKAIVYDAMGDYKNTIRLNFLPIRLVPTKTGFVHLYSEPKGKYANVEMEANNIHFLDDEGNFLYASKKDDTPLPIDIRSDLSFADFKNGTFLYQPTLSDTIYLVSENSVEVKYVFHSNSKYKILDYKDRQDVTFTFVDPKSISKIKDKIKDEYLFSWGEILDLNDYLYSGFSGLLESDRVKIYYSKAKNKAITVSPKEIRGNEMLCNIFMSPPIATDDESFYITISPGFLFKYEEQIDKLPEGKLKTFLLNTNFADMNPLLIKYSINTSLFE
jgi:hypothetical protein